MTGIVVFALMIMAVTAGNQQSNSKEKRSDLTKDILSEASCRYLKTHGYLDKDANWRKLCLKTNNQCKDVFSSTTCCIAKARNECINNSTVSNVYCKFTCNKCSNSPCIKSDALGMESKAIPDNRISASSYSWNSYAPQHARLNHRSGGGWAPNQNNGREWLQVHLRGTHWVTGIATQGSAMTYQWMTSYIIQYGMDGLNFTPYQSGKVLTGNNDTHTAVKHDLNPPITAEYIRVIPKGIKGWAVVRMELYGCKKV